MVLLGLRDSLLAFNPWKQGKRDEGERDKFDALISASVLAKEWLMHMHIVLTFQNFENEAVSA
jgi:hypothetical protein